VGGGIELPELFDELGDGKLEAEKRQFMAVGLADGIDEGILAETDFGEVLLVFAVILIPASLPVMDILLIQVFAGIAEALDDVLVLDAVIEHLVECVAVLFAEGGDFAGAAVVFGLGRRREDGERRSGRRGTGCIFGLHGGTGLFVGGDGLFWRVLGFTRLD
jgi:hypothetical protein